jgi:plasmid stabilization system protein ParE
MVQKVVFTKTADRAFCSIATFLEDNISLTIAEKFAQKLAAKIERLKEQPYIGRPSVKAKTVRKVIIIKHIHMMYRVVGKTLIICDFFDTRQDANKSRF